MRIDRHFECVVVGDGPAGLAAAAALAMAGIEVALASPGAGEIGTGQAAPAMPESAAEALADTRTAALFPPAIALLENLGAWTGLQQDCAPLSAIRIVDGTGSLLRAPEVAFKAADIDHPDLGHNVPNAGLAAALGAAALAAGVTLIGHARATGIAFSDRQAVVTLADGRGIAARLVVGADGSTSVCRRAAGIAEQRWSYDQAALACRFEHGRAHGGISTEIHGLAGPCTTVPLPGNVSSLVWIERPGEIARLVGAPSQVFARELERRLGGLLGTVSAIGPRRSFALSGMIAETLARERVALVGEAAHALPPIGAQGLNLGLADVAVLADCLAKARASGRDVGAAGVLGSYAATRAADVRRRVRAVDLLNRSLEPGIPPLYLARGAGLHVLAAMPGLRRRLMLEGLYPPAPLPRLMRPGHTFAPDRARDGAS